MTRKLGAAVDRTSKHSKRTKHIPGIVGPSYMAWVVQNYQFTVSPNVFVSNLLL